MRPISRGDVSQYHCRSLCPTFILRVIVTCSWLQMRVHIVVVQRCDKVVCEQSFLATLNDHNMIAPYGLLLSTSRHTEVYDCYRGRTLFRALAKKLLAGCKPITPS